MSEEQKQRKREYNREYKKHMTEEQKKKQREYMRNRYQNMPEKHKEKENERNRIYKSQIRKRRVEIRLAALGISPI